MALGILPDLPGLFWAGPTSLVNPKRLSLLEGVTHAPPIEHIWMALGILPDLYGAVTTPFTTHTHHHQPRQSREVSHVSHVWWTRVKRVTRVTRVTSRWPWASCPTCVGPEPPLH